MTNSNVGGGVFFGSRGDGDLERALTSYKERDLGLLSLGDGDLDPGGVGL